MPASVCLHFHPSLRRSRHPISTQFSVAFALCLGHEPSEFNCESLSQLHIELSEYVAADLGVEDGGVRIIAVGREEKLQLLCESTLAVYLALSKWRSRRSAPRPLSMPKAIYIELTVPCARGPCLRL
jgi:hypothetical protein